ncbi:MAG: hypothetical protein IIX61_02150, partial [Loktanella sp.]|nr:hypothetical protein [Loktanella sp.]
MAKAEISKQAAMADNIGPLVAEGADAEVIEYNRRLYSGRFYWVVAGALAIYAFFHIAALHITGA